MAERQVLERLAAACEVPLPMAEAAVALLEAGLAVPFIARYRREQTGGLEEEPVGDLARGLRHFGGLQRRKATILKRIGEEGHLTDAVRDEIENCFDRSELEDLYLAHRAKRRTRGARAHERGLEPLARAIVAQITQADSLAAMAAPFVDPAREVPDAAAALDGARDLLAEWIAEDPQIRGRMRQFFAQTGILRSRVVEGKKGQAGKYEMYYDFSEPVKSIPSHRVLALRRGAKEGWLEVRVEVERERALGLLREAAPKAPDAVTAPAIEAAIADAFDRLLAPAFESAVRADLKRQADIEAIRVFSGNLRHLLLQPPAGPRRTLGVQPCLRAGCALAALDEEGRLLEHALIFPHKPSPQADEAQAAARALIEKHAIEAIAIGSGAASREAKRFFRALAQGLGGQGPMRMIVSDAGAAVYASSRAAGEEFPELEAAVRAAVTIGRRFQDPLAELVKVDPRLIGVGQYQHDVHQRALREALEAVVESCVNAVGVDVNRASMALLARVAGLDRATAHELVQHRAAHGPFRSRAELKAVPRLSPERFEQAAPFLRVRGGEQPLDATAIHPAHYALVERIAADAGTTAAKLLGNEAAVERIEFARYASDSAGDPTLADIRRELLRPARDPRGPFRCVEFRDDLTDLEHLQAGMVLEGTVTNVTNFGAFVDIGVQEDGLVHVSELARRFVRDLGEVVRVGDIVRVKVLSADPERRRISLSIKQALAPPKRKSRPQAPRQKGKGQERPKEGKRPPHAKATAEDIARLIAHFESR